MTFFFNFIKALAYIVPITDAAPKLTEAADLHPVVPRRSAEVGGGCRGQVIVIVIPLAQLVAGAKAPEPAIACLAEAACIQACHVWAMAGQQP